MNPNDQVETLINALSNAQNDVSIWQTAYDASEKRCKALEDEVRKLNDRLDELRQNARLAGGEADE